MKLYYVICISGQDVFGFSEVGESYEEVFGRVIKALREKYGNAIDSVSLVEITQSNGYKVVLEKIDTPELPFVAGREDI